MWDERYAQPGFAYGTEPNDFLVEHAAELEGPVLSLAEGEGRNAVWLAERGLEVTAVDGSKVGLDKASALAASRGVSIHTVHADLADFRLEPEAWASIVSVWAHVPPALRRTIHANVVRGLRPGGVFVLEAYTPAQIELGTGGPRDPSLCMTLEGLREELAGLSWIVAREVRRVVREGQYHDGPSASVQLVARRPR